MTTTTRRSGERGLTMVLFALSLTAILALASLVMGGSNGYSAVRSSQTAADAAALAATKTMREVWQGIVPLRSFVGDPTTSVYDVAVKVAEENGADPGSVECEIVTAAYAVSNSEAHVLGECDGTWENARASDKLPVAAGVRVRVRETRDVPFGGVTGREEITASSVATATVQPVRGGFRSPFMICAFGGASGNDHGINLLRYHPELDDGDDISTPPDVFPPYTINPAALNVEYLLWANGGEMGSRNCDVTPWHGIVNTDITYQVPSDPDDPEGWWDIDTGSRVGHIPKYLSGPDTCEWDEVNLKHATNPEDDCRLILPLCAQTSAGPPFHDSGTNVRFNCVRMATFLVTYVGPGNQPGSCVSITAGQKVVCGRLLGDAGVASGGQGTLDPVDPFELATIKLVE